MSSPAPRQPRRPPRLRQPVRLRSSLLSWALLLLALLALRPLLVGFGWWWCAAGIATTAAGCALLLRLLLRITWLPALAALLGGGLALQLLTAPDALVLGVLPGPRLFAVDAALINAAAQSIREQSVPAQATSGILFLLGAVALVFATLLEVVVVELRVPLLAAPPVLLLLGTPIAFGLDRVDWWLWAAVAVALLLVMVEPGRLRPPALLAAVAVVAASLLLPAVLPHVGDGRSLLRGGTGGGTTADPVLDLGAALRSGSTATVLRYTVTGAVEPSYLRIATISDFGGSVWQPDALAASSTTSELSSPPQPAGMESLPDSRLATERIRIQAVGGERLPLPLAPVSIVGLTGVWRLDADTSVAVADTASVDGQQYRVDYPATEPTADQLAASDGGVPPGAGPRYLALPTMSPSIARTARQVVEAAGANTRTAEAAALQDWFRDDFSYSLTAPVADGFDGTGAAAVADFLRVRSGYCVHFASAMALMARTLGIPSRVVVGYLPGTVQQDSGVLSGTVSAQQLHAWPELWFDGVGWVRYEPTPEVADAPSWTQTVEDAPTTGPSATPGTPGHTASPSRPSSSRPSSASPSGGSSSAASSSASAAAAPGGSGPSAADLIWLFWAFVVAAVLAGPRLLRGAIRAARYRRVRAGGPGAVAAAVAELRAGAIDLGLPGDPGETLRAMAERLGVPAVAEFAALAEQLVYAPAATASALSAPAPTAPAELGVRLEAALAALRRAPGVGRARRIRAAILPRSLWAGRMVSWAPRATGS